MKINKLKPILTTLLLSSVLLLAGCAGLNLNNADDDSSASSSDTGQFTIGGTASGIDGSVLLVNNLTDAKSLSSAGAFTFGDALANGATYNVIVATQPLTQLCSVSNGAGTIATTNITNVNVTCSDTSYSIGGTISGLGVDQTVVLQNNNDDDLSLDDNGEFTFETNVADGASYNVTILTQPDTQLCSTSNTIGSVASENITDVAINCVDVFEVGGTLSGLTTASVTIQNNEGDDLVLSSAGTFAFDATQVDNTEYSISIREQPTGQTCVLSNETGTIDGESITTIALTCTPHYIWATATYFGGNLGGISGADSKCNDADDANMPNAALTYKAMIVSSTTRRACSTGNCSGGTSEHIDWALDINKTYLRGDGTTLIGTTNEGGIFEFPIENSFDPLNNSIWTGLSFEWTNAGNTCTAWTSNSSGVSGRIAGSGFTHDAAISFSNSTCDIPRRIYCVSQ